MNRIEKAIEIIKDLPNRAEIGTEAVDAIDVIVEIASIDGKNADKVSAEELAYATIFSVTKVNLELVHKLREAEAEISRISSKLSDTQQELDATIDQRDELSRIVLQNEKTKHLNDTEFACLVEAMWSDVWQFGNEMDPELHEYLCKLYEIRYGP